MQLTQKNKSKCTKNGWGRARRKSRCQRRQKPQERMQLITRYHVYEPNQTDPFPSWHTPGT